MKHFRQYIVPTSQEDAVSIRRAVGARGLFIAGGTTVVPRAARTVDVLIDVTHLGLNGIEFQESWVKMGATTRLADLLTPEIQASFPVLYEAVSQCATPLIRNMATLGGSLATVFLPSDVAVALLALDAQVEVLTEAGVQRLALGDLLRSGWLNPNWLLRSLSVKKQKPTRRSAFLKFGRTSVDIALVNVGASFNLDESGRVDLRIAIGQTSSLPTLEEFNGIGESDLTQSSIDRIASEVSKRLQGKSDFRASGEYRKHLSKVLVARALARMAGVDGYEG